ncbi:MAG: GNAT family N-acetyltransferase [Thiotrichaceae bacterium]
MNDILIRKAQSNDLPIMQEIARRTIDKCYRSFLGDEGVDWFINSGEADKELQKYINNCDVVIQENTIVAFSIYFEDLIHLMMVDVVLHRTGIGSKLLAHSEHQLIACGYITIRLETFEGNHQAINFYLKNGWSITMKQEDKEHGFIRIFFEKKV